LEKWAKAQIGGKTAQLFPVVRVHCETERNHPQKTLKETRMNRTILAYVLLSLAAAPLLAQQASQSDPYQGVSNPPADDTIVVTTEVHAKPAAGKPLRSAATSIDNNTVTPQSTPNHAAVPYPVPGEDDIVQVQQTRSSESTEPGFATRATTPNYSNDPDGDIVHPHGLRPNELASGSTIRVRLLSRLSTAESEKGEVFRSRVVVDVMQGGQVLIPAGSEIDGHIAEASSGHFGGRGNMRLRPETVILPNGSRYHLHAEVSATPGNRARVDNEGTIQAPNRVKRDSIEYGGAVGAGAATGAMLGGPVGALTGSLIGAGVVTAHLLVSHPQAVLETGTNLVFTLTEPLAMDLAESSGE
jgi:hypothetical protein